MAEHKDVIAVLHETGLPRTDEHVGEVAKLLDGGDNTAKAAAKIKARLLPTGELIEGD